MVKEAAVAAGLDPTWSWQVWMRDFDVAIVGTAENMAFFDQGEEAFWQAFQGTPGEETLNAALEMFMTEVQATTASREVWEVEDGWGYVPAEGGIEEPKFASMMEFWIKPAMRPTFEELAGEISAFLGELGGPYPVNAYRAVFGDVDRVIYVAFNDNWSDYYGARSLEAGLAASGKTAEWEALMERMRDCITDLKTSQWTYVPDVSYAGAGM